MRLHRKVIQEARAMRELVDHFTARLPAHRQRGARRLRSLLLASALAIASAGATLGASGTARADSPSPCPDATTALFGPDVCVFNPTMAQSTIQADVDAIAQQQVGNQFGAQRYALFFEPGTYGTASNPLNFQVGYYTEVAGLGRDPAGVVINGSVYVRNQCFGANNCTALDNFWRSLSNLTINVATPGFGCYSGEFWAVSQASPMRRVDVNGFMTLMDYCTSPSFASGGFIADSEFTGSTIVNGSQQQWITRNSTLDGWTNGVWNQVFSGDVGAPPTCFPASGSCGGGPYTTLAASPVTREEPYLYQDASGTLDVFVPAVQTKTVGPSWGSGSTPGISIPLERFFIARPSTPESGIDAALAGGRDLILTPGVYDLDAPIVIPHPDTVVIGLGFATLIPQRGQPAMLAASNSGVEISGLIFDAGPQTSPVLLSVGTPARDRGSAGDPDVIQDVFFRIGGAETTPTSATISLLDQADHSIIDDVWAWRADHGSAVGWTVNRADTGVVVAGDDVTAYGLFVEHYQKYEVIWSGQGGTDVFFQNEMPYDPPSQSAWMAAPGIDGYPAFYVPSKVRTFQGYGMASYSFFDLGINIYSSNAFVVPATLPSGSLHDLLTVFLSTAGAGGILNVIDDTGGASTIANPDTPVTVVSFP
jgi:hypothetical protein